MKFGVVVFPGSNCDDDMVHVLGRVMGQEVRKLWHKDTQALSDFHPGDCLVLPGGFSYGDYLRSGAIASHSPIMASVRDFAHRGGFVWGICNGFQVLCEMGLLPGVLLRNEQHKFICKHVHLKVEETRCPITQNLSQGEVVRIPIAHADGRYHADADTLSKLNANGQVLFRYCSPSGECHADHNPNGSVEHIAGICNEERNVFGMMPHPERCAEADLGYLDGKRLFEGLIGKMQLTA